MDLPLWCVRREERMSFTDVESAGAPAVHQEWGKTTLQGIVKPQQR